MGLEVAQERPEKQRDELLPLLFHPPTRPFLYSHSVSAVGGQATQGFGGQASELRAGKNWVACAGAQGLLRYRLAGTQGRQLI